MEGQFGWSSGLDNGWRKGPWTPQEDKLLIEHVNLHGEGRWNSVSRLTGKKFFNDTSYSFILSDNFSPLCFVKRIYRKIIHKNYNL